MAEHPIEALLRPPVEWTTTLAALSAAAIALAARDALLMTAAVARGFAAMMALLALVRFAQGYRVVRYQRGLNRPRRYRLDSDALIEPGEDLFLGRGFRWTATHTQRLWDVTRAVNRRYLEPGARYRLARRLDAWWPALGHRLAEPLPPRSGLVALHGVGGPEGDAPIHLPAAERQGHLFYVGTTGVGKTRAAELAIARDIHSGHPVIVMDPKGDSALFRRMAGEARKAGRAFHFFHLGYPDHSARYNPIGRFSRITEVATRIANQLPSQGNAEAFRQFAWLFTHVIARALVALGEKPDYRKTLQAMNHIEPLLVRYFEHWLDHEGPSHWRQLITGEIQDRPKVPHHLKNRDPRALALVRFYQEQELYDPVADGLRRAFEYEKTFFDKISVAVQPLLEKLLSGQIGELINPDYADLEDPRPILDWQSVVRQRAVVYCGFDALTDPEVAGVVGQSMIADLVAFAGELYKHGLGQALPVAEEPPETFVHLDEFSELVRGPEIIQALNKGRGAGLRFSVYTQTLADIAAGLGDRERAGQVIGNVSNTIVMLRVADLETAELLAKRLGTVEVNLLMRVSGATDSSQPDSPVDFTSSTQERVGSQTVPLLEPGHLMQLPRGHAFVLMAGGQLHKLQCPELSDPPAGLPADLDAIAADMARRYSSAAAVDLAAAEDSIDWAALRGIRETIGVPEP